MAFRCVSAIDSNGRTIWIVDAHRDDGKRFVVRADEKLTAFLELESAIREILLLRGKGYHEPVQIFQAIIERFDANAFILAVSAVLKDVDH